MKNKRSITLFFALICVVVLISTLIWSCAKAPEGEQGKEQDSSVGSSETADDQVSDDEPATDNNTAQQPETDKTEVDNDENNEPATDKPEEDKPSTDKPSEDEPSNDKPDTTPSEKEPEDKPVFNISGIKLKERTKEEIEAILNDPFMLLVNRDNVLSKDYSPSNLVTYSGSDKLNQTCADALRKLINAGKKAGYSYTMYSGYRSYTRQYNKYYGKIEYWEGKGYSKEEAIRRTNQYYAPPGASEHHTGLAADVCIPEIVNKYACLHEAYDTTEEFKWFSAHAHEYGFILRYPNGDEDITGYSYEPWHYRYVGLEVAEEIYNLGITMEEYVAALEKQLASFE